MSPQDPVHFQYLRLLPAANFETDVVLDVVAAIVPQVFVVQQSGNDLTTDENLAHSRWALNRSQSRGHGGVQEPPRDRIHAKFGGGWPSADVVDVESGFDVDDRSRNSRHAIIGTVRLGDEVNGNAGIFSLAQQVLFERERIFLQLPVDSHDDSVRLVKDFALQHRAENVGEIGNVFRRMLDADSDISRVWLVRPISAVTL